jgi:hypothetical protein
MRNTFNTKNTYENILTGINKEEGNKNPISGSAELFLTPCVLKNYPLA